jgi:hypothetical protein
MASRSFRPLGMFKAAKLMLRWRLFLAASFVVSATRGLLGLLEMATSPIQCRLHLQMPQVKAICLPPCRNSDPTLKHNLCV